MEVFVASAVIAFIACHVGFNAGRYQQKHGSLKGFRLFNYNHGEDEEIP